MTATKRRRIVILGAAGRDFHNFNVAYRDDASVDVVAFTAAQIPNISGRRYPPLLAGPLYPAGIPIESEDALEELCRSLQVDEVIFAYSDVPHAHVMHLASRALAAGADFALLGPHRTMLRAKRTVIAISAVRTGCGKSPIARWVAARLRAKGARVAVLRHPMPYGDLAAQRVQRFATKADLDAADCTAEEREEYEPHIAIGNVVFAGVDYAAILEAAEAEAEIIVWDGGNNDFPFLRPDIHIVVVDALRPDNVTSHHPGEAVARSADIVVINKVDTASPAQVDAAVANVRGVNTHATIVRGALPVRLDDPDAVRGKRVLVVEDGPTITHGNMPHGAGFVAARQAHALPVDPRPWLTPGLRRAFAQYPHIGPVLPALGYGAAQIAELRETVEAVDAEAVIAATPIDLASLLHTKKPIVRARYEFSDVDEPGLAALLDTRLIGDRRTRVS